MSDPASSPPSAAPMAAPAPPSQDSIFDLRALLIGLAAAAVLVPLLLVFKVASYNYAQAKREALKQYEFKLGPPPTVEEPKFAPPVRGIVRERVEAGVGPAVVESKPNIHIAVRPSDVPVETEVIQGTGANLNTRENDIKIDPKDLNLSSAKTDLDIPDGPEEISVVSETTGYAIKQIAVDTLGPADIFKYAKPAPRDKPAMYTVNMGPRPGRSIKGVLPAFGDQDAPSFGEKGPVNINLFGTGGDFLRIMDRSGGVKAKTAVDSALTWLANHQGPDGMWDAEKFDGQKNGSLADTGLASLAFMGGGNTTRKGEYMRNVLKGCEAIMRHQKDDGRLTAGGDNLYTHAICTIALAEAYGRARDERIGAAAQKAISFCEKAQNADGGWRYTPKSEDSDMSVTAWFIQAFKTARLANLKFDHTVYSQAMAFVAACTDKGASAESNGAVTYQPKEDQSYANNGHPALTCAGMMIRQFDGMGQKNHILVKGAEWTQKRPPTWNDKDFYYWYYATYAMHNMGGEYRLWWTQRIRDVLLEKQAHDGDNAGSWDPKGDRWGGQGGRVYTTALGSLCLEVYYRYSEALNSFGVAPDLDELFAE